MIVIGAERERLRMRAQTGESAPSSGQCRENMQINGWMDGCTFMVINLSIYK